VSNRAEKEAKVAEVRKSFEKAMGTVLLDFRGIDVPTITALRARFRQAGIEYKVVKNKLVEKALVGTPLETNGEFLKHLRGPTGIAWSFEDPTAAAKIIKAFRKDGGEPAEKLQVKCGLIDNTVFGGEAVESQMAMLPGKDEIRAQLLAQLLAPAQNLVRQLNAPGQNFAYLMDARKRQLEEG
jgi:large subunit ribosomal protein L10